MEGEQPKEDAVDVCTSALGIMSSSFFIDENSDEMTSTVREGVSTLLFVRNEDGSWPSKISLVSQLQTFCLKYNQSSHHLNL